MEKRNTKTIILIITWTLLCAGVLALNLAVDHSSPSPDKKAWWHGLSLEQINSSPIYLEGVKNTGIGLERLQDFAYIKALHDGNQSIILTLFALIELSELDRETVLRADKISIEGLRGHSPGLIALVGSSITKMAQYEIPNIEKLAWVSLGQKTMDAAISMDQNNPAAHAVRFYNNQSLPGFLQRNQFNDLDSPFLTRTAQ